MKRSWLCPAVVLLSFGAAPPAPAQDRPAEGRKAPPLEAVLRVKVNADLKVSCQFDLPGTKDQSFQNSEYRYAVLDKEGVQVEGAYTVQLPLRTIKLPKDKRSVTDPTDAVLNRDKLKPGQEYYFVVSVRNLTGLARFKAP